MDKTRSLRERIEKVTITEKDLLDIVQYKFGFTKEQLSYKIRKKEYVDARRFVFYVLKRKLRMSLKRIGLNYGGRDHTTVSHSIKKFYDLYETDLDYQKKCNEVFDILDIN